MLKLLKNKYLLTAGAVLVFGLTIAIGILYAKDRVALNDILNEEEAVNFAYLDAGVSSDDVISYTAKRDKALGEYVYKINFSSKDTTYSYVVDANHGDIISGIKENTGIPVVMPQINPQRQRQMIPQKTRLQKSLIKQSPIPIPRLIPSAI